jgi:hypothetical protein
MPQIWNDKTIKIKYDPQYVKQRFTLNAIGPEPWTTIAETTLTHTDDDTIYVSGDTGNDTTGDGTSALPYATEVKGISECDIDHPYVLILDSADYAEDYTGVTNEYWIGTFAAVGETPRRSRRTLDFTPADSNSKFVSKDGDDSTGDGTMETPYLTIAKAASTCDGSHQKVVIMDSEEYIENAFDTSGDFNGVYSVVGQAPTIKFLPYKYADASYTEIISETTLHDNLTNNDVSFVKIANGNILYLYTLDDGAGNKVYGKIYNVAFDAVTSETLIYTDDNRTQIYDAVLLDDENIAIVYYKQGGGLYNIIISPELVKLHGPTLIHDNYLYQICNLAALTNGGFIAVFARLNAEYTAYSAHYVGMDDEGTVDIAVVDIITGLTYQPYVDVAALRQSDGFAIVVNYPNGGDITSCRAYYRVCENSGASRKASTLIRSQDASQWRPIAVCESRIDGRFMVALGDGASGGFYYIYDSDGGAVKGETAFASSAAIMGTVICRTVEGGFALIIYDYVAGNNYTVKSIVYDYEGTNILAAQSLSTVKVEAFPMLMDDGSFACGYRANGPIIGIHRFALTYAISIYAAVAATFNGFTIDADNGYLNGNLFYGDAAALAVQHCHIKNGANGIGYYASAMRSDDAVSIENSIIQDYDSGISVVANDFSMNNTNVFRINHGYAIDVDGAAAVLDDILFDHCDFFACYGGIHLENNNGTNETIKNCIFHDNAVYAIDAETEVTFSNSICTDAVTGAAEGSSVRHANPLYKNEGYIDPDDTDLTLKNSDVGDGITSPGITLGDDGKNAGAIDDIYPGSGVSWSEIEITKPEVLPITREYAGAVNLQLASGDYESYFDGRSEMLKFKWKGISNDDYDELDKVLDCDSNELLIYFEPDTNPAIYYAFTLLREAVSAGNSYYLLDSVGKEDVEVSVARKYERET